MALTTSFSRLDTCKRLAEAGFNCDSVLPGNESAAHCAVQLKHLKTIKLITQYDSDTDFHLRTRWCGLTVHEFRTVLKYEEAILNHSPRKVPVNCALSDNQCNRIDINGGMTVSELNAMSSTIYLRKKTQNTLNPDQALNALESTMKYAYQCKLVGKLSLVIAARISHVFCKHYKYIFMQFEPQLSGSRLAKTKCYLPDECDVVCIS